MISTQVTLPWLGMWVSLPLQAATRAGIFVVSVFLLLLTFL